MENTLPCLLENALVCALVTTNVSIILEGTGTCVVVATADMWKLLVLLMPYADARFTCLPVDNAAHISANTTAFNISKNIS